MKCPLHLGVLGLLVAISYFVLCPTPANSISTQGPNTHGAIVQGPIAGKCNPEYSLQSYNGNIQCVKCNPGYEYMRGYNNQDLCVKIER